MDTYSNDQNAHVLETLDWNILILRQEFPPDGGGFFYQSMPTTLIR